ncbi:uncharacterized protein LOC124381229 [Silurus meridionalis]|uniref:uncharacterized protein LOC124381229 n=1 Tax=Silurus meridionalis TaxID=175797 RepID=UPI001EE9F458|nr:uncharacterized protein LOC124381229 [Silurus meridionalis]
MVTLQEVEGTTITLHTGITGIQTDARIDWFYGPEKAEEIILNSQMFKGETVTEISERFKEKLQLNRTSGALTIRNISRNHSGVYLLHVITEDLYSRTFRVSVYDKCCDAGLLSAAGDEMVTLQKVEGTTITLHTGITGIQSDAHIVWFNGPEKAEKKILNSQMFKGETVTEISERFKERLQLDRSSGALTIRNISRNHSGVYLLQVITEDLSSRTFRVSVYAPVSTPVINLKGKRSGFSTESCSLLCSVENGEDVKLSWYRENERISITNNTDLSVPLNLPLQIQHHEKNTYICVSANPVSNKTTSLSITQLCVHNSGQSERSHSLLPVLISAGVLLLVIITGGFLWIWKHNKCVNKLEELIYTEVKITAHSAERSQKEEHSRRTDHPEQDTFILYSVMRLCDAGLLNAAGDEMVTLQEVEGTTITLHTGITGIQTDAHIVWFYGPEKAEEKILNSQMFKGETVTEISERFKERLQLDRISGALTIRNISRNHSGVYLLHIITGRLSSRTFRVSVYEISERFKESLQLNRTSGALTIRNISRNHSGVYLLQVITEDLSSRTFRVSVYAPVSTPVINLRGKSSGFSTESCSLLCSVENGEDVNLSWYRENERISITNNTDLSVPLNLPLQIQHHEKNTYICVSANPVSNKTTSLSITQLCVHNSGESDGPHSLLPVLISAGVLLLVIITGGVLWIWKHNKCVNKLEEVIYTEVKITAHSAERRQKVKIEINESFRNYPDILLLCLTERTFQKNRPSRAGYLCSLFSDEDCIMSNKTYILL